jgi:hypothetical protein
VYGSLMRGLRKVGIWPRMSPDDVLFSLESLYSGLKDMRIGVFHSGHKAYQAHHDCAIQSLEHELLEVMSSITDPVLKEHRNHMKSQAHLPKLDMISLEKKN